MNIKKHIKIFILTLIMLITSITGVIAMSSTVDAYTCPGTTSGGAPYYFKDGRCYEPYYEEFNPRCPSGTRGSCSDSQKTCGSNNGQPKNGKCYSRDESQDKVVSSVKPIHDDGSQVTEWKCPAGFSETSGGQCRKCPSGSQSGRGCTTAAKVPKHDKDPTQKNQNTEDENQDPNQDPNDQTPLTQGECENSGKHWYNGKCNDVSQPGAANKNSTGKCSDNDKVRTAIITDKIAEGACDGQGVSLIGNMLKYVLTILSIGVGVVAVGGIAYGALLYTSARDNSGQTQQAITIIRNVVIGLLLYVFMVAILNWLVPGGVIG